MKLLITGAFQAGEDRLDELARLGHEVVWMGQESDPLPPGATEAQGIVGNGLFLHHEPAQFPDLEFVQLTSAGLDRAPIEELERRGVAWFNARGVYHVPIAEWVVMQVLQVAKRAAFFHDNQREHRWEKARGLTELVGGTACIVGFGEIGQEVARRLRAFGMRIVGVNTSGRPSELADEVVATTQLATVLPEADVVVLAVPLTPETHHLFNDSTIELMRDDAILVNVSRGDVIDEAALLRALDAGAFAGVALDVFADEPLAPDSPWWAADRVLVTPHNSFASDGNIERLWQLLLTNLTQHAAGRANP